ncbi:MAG: hypothetical protein KAS13_04540 [Candidatus Omnitrophica bacterium]|nr:hypothetical protein [Candidatus Omnitrophota bacterium]MCK5592366.1 hypothetical protein [Candidatus Paceibacterota bacterium]
MKKILLVFLFSMMIAGTVMASEQLSEVNTKFTYKDSPIHPFLIRQFLNWTSDYRSPILTTVDVSAAFDTNQYQITEIKKQNDWLFSEKEEIDGDIRLYESFHYHWVGKMQNGIHVLETGSSGGGSGFFMDLMFVRFSEDEILWESKKESQLLMSIVGIYSLGDRYDGDIKVYANKVLIPASRGQFGGGAIDKEVELKFPIE